MNRLAFVSTVSQKTDVTKSTVDDILDAMIDTILDAVYDGDGVQISGFGQLKVRTRDSRMGYNPQTGERLQIPARKVCVFRPGKHLKDALK